jgi:hypothetical protein
VASKWQAESRYMSIPRVKHDVRGSCCKLTSVTLQFQYIVLTITAALLELRCRKAANADPMNNFGWGCPRLGRGGTAGPVSAALRRCERYCACPAACEGCPAPPLSGTGATRPPSTAEVHQGVVGGGLWNGLPFSGCHAATCCCFFEPAESLLTIRYGTQHKGWKEAVAKKNEVATLCSAVEVGAGNNCHKPGQERTASSSSRSARSTANHRARRSCSSACQPWANWYGMRLLRSPRSRSLSSSSSICLSFR